MKKPRRSEGASSEWLNTYADMVTLLLCFFVLLYSMSTVDSAKWKIIVESFNPSAGELSQIVANLEENNGGYGIDGGLDGGETEIQEVDFDELYYRLSKYIETENLQADVEISKGDGFTFITFRDNVFFNGDSYKLRKEGEEILDQLASAIKDVSNSIEEIQVLGHTSQADPNRPNEVVSDRFLASNRAAEVLVYIQKKNIVDPSRLVSTGYGQFRPIDSFDTRESRARNRRVEIIITKNDSVVKSLDNYYKEVYGVEGVTGSSSQNSD